MTYNIALVHLGPRWIEYLADCMEQIVVSNPADCRYWLVVSRQHKGQLSKISCIDRWHVEYSEQVNKTVGHRIFNHRSRLDKSFRNGFWQLATERFYYLYELSIKHKLTDLIHLENDNLLYLDIREKLSTFRQHYSVGAVFDNDERCIPGFMYFRDRNALRAVTSYLGARVKEGLNDMEVLAKFHREMGSTGIANLPILPTSFVRDEALKSLSGKRAANPMSYCNNFEVFEGVFDGAALGQYLGGIDTDGDKRIGFINESCLFDPSRFVFSWDKNTSGLTVPFLSYNGLRVRIHNLHIHSKALGQFVSQREGV